MLPFNLLFVDNAFLMEFYLQSDYVRIVCYLKQSDCFRLALKFVVLAQFFRIIHALFKADQNQP